MSVALPALPWQTPVKPRLRRFGTDLEPALGGPAARINRLGNRYAVDIALPTLLIDQASLWISQRLLAETTNVTLTLTWPSALYAGLATAVVNGAGQAGSNLSVKGLGPGAIILPLTPFSFFINGRNFLHLTTQGVTADAYGNAILSIAPMLRVQPTDSLALSFLNPTIEGFASGSTIDWELQLARYHKISFALAENA